MNNSHCKRHLDFAFECPDCREYRNISILSNDEIMADKHYEHLHEIERNQQKLIAEIRGF